MREVEKSRSRPDEVFTRYMSQRSQPARDGNPLKWAHLHEDGRYKYHDDSSKVDDTVLAALYLTAVLHALAGGQTGAGKLR